MSRAPTIRRAAAGVVAVLAVLACGLPPRGALAQGRTEATTDEDRLFATAEKAFAARNFDQAADAYRQVLKRNPRRVAAYVKLATIQFAAHRYADNLELLTAARKVAPTDVDVLGQLGLNLYMLGRSAEAVKLLEEVARTRPSAYDVQAVLGQHYLRVRDGARAVTAFEAYLSSRPEDLRAQDTDIFFLLGSAYLLAGRLQHAEEQLARVLRERPTDAGAQASMGAVYTARGDYPRAVRIFQGLGTRILTQPAATYNFAFSLLKLGKLREALAPALRYQAARPNEAKGLVLVGDIRFALGDLAAAAEAFGQAARLEPRHVPILLRLGRTERALHHYRPATEALEQALSLWPDDPEVLAELGQVYLVERNTPRAVATAQQLLRLRPQEVSAQVLAGLAALQAKALPEASLRFKEALRLDPRHERARQGLAVALNLRAAQFLDAGVPASARNLLGEARDANPTLAASYKNLALLAVGEQNLGAAQRFLSEAEARIPGDAEVQHMLAVIARRQGRLEEAQRRYETVLGAATRPRGEQAALLWLELGGVHAARGQDDQTVTALESALREASPGGETRKLAAGDLAASLLWRGQARVRARRFDEGLQDFTAVLALADGASASQRRAAEVALGASYLAAGRCGQAIPYLQRAGAEGSRFLRPPYDRVGVPLLVAYCWSRDPSAERREQAAQEFQRLLGKAPGPLAARLRDLERATLEQLAYDYWERGDARRATAGLRQAERIPGPDRPSLQHNLAVTELATGGQPAAGAVSVLERLSGRFPEALVNLGLYHDRQGDPRRALDLFRAARDRGVRSPRLREWIDVKERMFPREPERGAGGGR